MSVHATTHTRTGELSITFSRQFDAPAALVHRAHTDVELFGRWMGPEGTSCAIDHFDARTGGSYRYSVVGAGDARFTFFGSYHEVAADRIVHTWEYERDRHRPTLEVLTFVDLGDRSCRLDGLSVFTSPLQAADMIDLDASGDGMDENFDRLDAVLASALGGPS